MKKSRRFVAVYAVLVIILSTAPKLTQALSLSDGGNYVIDYVVTDGLDITNGTTVTLETGANISGTSASLNFSTIYLQDSTLTINSGVVQGAGDTRSIIAVNSALNINDGLMQGSVESNVLAIVEITGGTMEGGLFNFGSSSVSISGGNIDHILADESGADFNISGGTIGYFSAYDVGLFNITGGTFLGSLDGSRFAVMTIKGGNFTSGFSYSGGIPYDFPPPDNFIFYGDLMLDTPTLVGVNGDITTYETMINGTLMDGTTISQTITCNDVTDAGNDWAVPCNGVALVRTVPIPPSVWLFGSGLLGLTGIARRKKAA